MRSRRSRRLDASGEIKSTASLVTMVGMVVFAIRFDMAMAVSEFLERSPIMRESPEDSCALARSGDFAKEPDSVEGVKMKFDRGGSLDLRVSGRIVLTSLTGKFCDKYSEDLTALAKFWLLPPTTEIMPVFCSGIFQERSLKSSFLSCFCQYERFSIKTPIL